MNDSNDDDDIMPSIPLPRSVALQPVAQPFLGISSMMGMTNEKASKTSSSSSSSSSNNKRPVVEPDYENQTREAAPRPTTTATPTTTIHHSWTWKVNHLMTVPMFHPLECTSVLLKDLPLDEISARISIFMRLHSIACSYRSDMGRVDCLTPCLIKFSVQLWRSLDYDNATTTTTSPADTASNVIIEISRMQGCAIGMQRLRNSLLYAVMTGLQPEVSALQQQRMGKCPSRVLRDMYEQYVKQSGHGSTAQESHCQGAFLLAVQLLESDSLDQNKLGMESLSVLTNPSTVCESEADWIAKAIVYGEGEQGVQVQSVLAKYLSKVERPEHTNRGGGSVGLIYDDSGDESGFLQYAQGCSFGMMHNFALLVLTHSLERLVTRKSDSHNDDEMVDMSSAFWKNATSSILYNLHVAQHRPHEASHSARCLALLEQLEPTLLEYVMEEDRQLPVVVMQAQEFGKMHHWTLERESGNLMNAMQQKRQPSVDRLMR